MADLTVDLVGDVNLRRHVESDATGLDDVAPELARADARLANLEGCFAASEAALQDKQGWFHCQPDMAKLLVGNFDLVSCANNVHHPDVVCESMQVLDELGILHTGAGATLEEAHRPAVAMAGGTRLGMLGYTSIFQTEGQEATPGRPGVATIKAYTAYEASPRVLLRPGSPPIVRTWADPAELTRACADVKGLRAEVDLLVVYLHFGVSSSPQIHDYQKEIAHALVDAGADVVAGSHSHTINGVELYDKAVIFYGLGNFVFNTGFLPHATRDGALAQLTVRDGSVAEVALLPTHRAPGDRTKFVDPSTTDGARLAEMVVSRSAELGTRAEILPGRVRLLP
jgi:poly-gamma-glutamate synthesis protein (capsule biosynthesis protein)